MEKLKNAELEKVAGGYTNYKENAVAEHIGEHVSPENLVIGNKYIIYDFDDARYSIAFLLGISKNTGMYGNENVFYKLKYDDGSTSDKRCGNNLSFFNYK